MMFILDAMVEFGVSEPSIFFCVNCEEIPISSFEYVNNMDMKYNVTDRALRFLFISFQGVCLSLTCCMFLLRTVAVTQILWTPRGLLVDQFDSKEDLINAVFTSSFIPG